MAVYLTKSMLSKFNKLRYSANSITDSDEFTNSSASGDHWQRFYIDGNKSFHLASDMICRVCARHGDISLTEKVWGVDIMSAISSITNVTVQIDDSLPKFICCDCCEFLKVALTFKKNCEVSDRRFKQILNPNGDPLMHSYPYSKHDFQLILHQMKLKRLKIAEKKEKERKRWEKMQEKKNESKTKNDKHTCSPCDLSFPNKEKLLEHRREKQCMRRACELCGQLVLSIAQHMRHIHKQNVLHKCPTCGKEFPVVARLRNHMLVHTNTFNFFCDLCPYKCKHKYYLVMHMRTHTGEKPYKCGLCPATFVNPSNLNKHKLTHQEKQFKCVLCEKAFRTTSALREHHEATHMNIKHACNYCGRDFCYKSDLRKHEIRSHNRTKRDYIGGEPTYKQVERMQKLQEDPVEPVHGIQPEHVANEKWHHAEVPILSMVSQPPPLLHTSYTIEHTKEFVQSSQQPLYFSDVVIQQPQDLVQQQTVQLSLPELLKKDDVKLYESQQGIGYF